ncbi:hypothetical protein BSKO_04301 [Bryopsis sp. KO-2023]|nr:hypothetical protein BSKO_04301 [Bryopsis sp. KO-2023]
MKRATAGVSPSSAAMSSTARAASLRPMCPTNGHSLSCGVIKPPRLNRRRTFTVKAQADWSQPPQQPPPGKAAFLYPKEKEGLQGTLSDLPAGMASVGAVGVLGIAAIVGYVVGGKAPADVRNVGRAVGTAVGVGSAAFAVSKMGEARQGGAGVDLYNTLVAKDDPGTLQRYEVEEIEKKYGVNMSEKLVSELKMVYDQYLDSMIPRGAELTGSEPEMIRSFKEALAISDEDAAAVHMDVGRRLSRLTFESENKGAEAEARRAFQKWIYISYRVFGERQSAFLLPLPRVFGLNQSQIMVARRDNAKSIFRSKIEETGAPLQADRRFLEALKAYQLEIQLKDEVASEVIMECARRRVESSLDAALKNVKERSRKKDYTVALREMEGVLEFNRQMDALAAEGSDLLPAGLGKVTIHGGVFEMDVSSADQRELYKVFLEERMALDGQMTVQLEKDLEDMMIVLALGPKEADAIREEVASKMYRKLLKEEVTSGRLDAADSKASVLQKLCDRLRFRPELASQMHRSIFKQKVESILAADDKISDEMDVELNRLRKLMCIPERDVDEVMLETVGGRLKAVIDDALAAGIDNFSEQDRKNVRKGMDELRTPPAMAKTILEQSVRQAFLKFISQSRLKANRLEAAKELKKMVFFSNVVVSPMLEEVKGIDSSKMAAAQAEFEDTLAEAKRMAEAEENAKKGESSDGESAGDEASASTDPEAMPSSLKKSKEGAESFKESDEVGDVKMSSQKEITLKEDLDLRDRVDIYRNYLIYCMSGDVLSMPMGGTVVLERDTSEFGRLSQLGDVLGLSPMDVMKVHTDMAEDAYRNQVKAILADGMLTKEKTDSLSEMREKLGLTKEQGDKIVRGVQNEALAQSAQSAKAMGDLDIKKILDMKESGVDINSFTSSEFRKSLYQKEAEKAMSDGRGEFDDEYFLEQLPEDLVIDKKQALRVVKDVALSKSKLLTVQAMSDLRMKKFDNVIQDVNNLMVCIKVADSNDTNGVTQWERREEVLDLFSVYYWKVKDETKVTEVQNLFGVSDAEADPLKKVVDTGGLKWAEEVQQEDEIFF